MKVSKRLFLLLEVMIGFALVVLCAIPLVYPHIALLRAEREFLEEIDADRLAHQVFIELVEKMYMNEIPLEVGKFPYETNAPFDVSYTIKVAHEKKGSEEGQRYLELSLIIECTKKDKMLAFPYVLFVEERS